MPEELSAGRDVAREIASECVLELHCTALGHGVPEFRGAEVDVVDCQIHVLYVPCERRAPHSEVSVRCIIVYMVGGCIEWLYYIFVCVCRRFPL